MKKLLLSIFFTTTLTYSFIYAEINKTKDANKAMGNDEFMKEFLKLNQELENEKVKTEKAQQKLEASRKEKQKLDELGNLLGIQYK